MQSTNLLHKNKAQHTVQDSDINYTHVKTPQTESNNTIDYKQLIYGILLVVLKKSLIKPQVWFDVCACSTVMYNLYTLLPPSLPDLKKLKSKHDAVASEVGTLIWHQIVLFIYVFVSLFEYSLPTLRMCLL